MIQLLVHAVGILDDKNIWHILLKEEFEYDEELFMELPQGMGHHYWSSALLRRLLKSKHGLKQTVLYFW